MSRKGFSLFEVIIVAAVTAVIATAGFLLLANRQANADLRATAEQAVSALRMAQQNSLSAASSTAWGVRFDNADPDAARFVVFASSTYAQSAETMAYPMSRRVAYDAVSVPASTTKDVVFGIRTGTTASTSVVFRIPDTDKTYVISISSLGLVTATYVLQEESEPGAPTVSGIDPSSGSNSGSISVTSISGTGFVSGATIKLTRTGQADITGTGFSYAGPTSLTGGSFDITGAATGTWSVVVTNPDTQNGTCNACFTVTVPSAAPTVTDVDPSSAAQGGSNPGTTITGTGFVDGASVAVSGTGVTVSDVVFVSQTELTADISVSGGAALGARDVTVTNPDLEDGTCAGCFEVTAAAPTVTGASPSTTTQGAAGAVITLTGTGFISGATPSFSGSGITVTTSSVTNATTMSVTINVSSTAATTSRNVTVTNPDLQQGTCSSCFTVEEDAGQQDTGYLLGSAYDDQGSEEWTNPYGDAWFTDDASPTNRDDVGYVYLPASGDSQPALFTGWEFDIPPTATVDKICVLLNDVAVGDDFSETQHFRVDLTWDGGGSFTASNDSADDVTLALPGSDVYYIDPYHVTASDPGTDCTDWERTWTPAEMSSSNFGVRLRGYNDNISMSQTVLYVDVVRVKVYYTP